MNLKNFNNMIYIAIVSNKKDKLQECINNLNNQTIKDFVIITSYNDENEVNITNNRTYDSYRHSRLYLPTLGDIRNKTIEYFLNIASEKDRLLWLDDDDRLSDNFIEESYINDYSDVLSIAHYDRYKNDKYSYTTVEPIHSFNELMDIKIFPFVWGKSYSYSCLSDSKVRFAPTNNYEELPFYYNAIKYYNWTEINTINYEYRTSDSSVSNPKNIDLTKMFNDLYTSLDYVDDNRYSINMLKNEINYLCKHMDEYRKV